MQRTLAELFKEIARQAAEFDAPILEHLCLMAAVEAAHSDIAFGWDWHAGREAASPGPVPDAPSEQAFRQNTSVTAKPYRVWTRKGTGSYSVFVPNAKAALAAAEDFSGRGHLEVFIKDMDGNTVDPEVLQVIVDIEANPTIRLVPR